MTYIAYVQNIESSTIWVSCELDALKNEWLGLGGRIAIYEIGELTESEIKDKIKIGSNGLRGSVPKYLDSEFRLVYDTGVIRAVENTNN